MSSLVGLYRGATTPGDSYSPGNPTTGLGLVTPGLRHQPSESSLDGATLSSTVGERLLAISTSPKGGISVELVTGLGNMGTFDPAKPSRGSASGQKGLVYMRRGKRTTFA